MYAHTLYNCDTFPSSQIHRNSVNVNVFRGLQNEEMSFDNTIVKSKCVSNIRKKVFE